VHAFDGLDPGTVLVLGTDGKLWLENEPFGTVPPARTLIDTDLMMGPGCTTAPAVAQGGDDSYVADGQTYGWYDDGWDGPGWYIVGYEFRRGFGFGGREGWHGWKHHGSHAHTPQAGGHAGGGGPGGGHGHHVGSGLPGPGHRYGAVHAGSTRRAVVFRGGGGGGHGGGGGGGHGGGGGGGHGGGGGGKHR
jgi:hypothetical protein